VSDSNEMLWRQDDDADSYEDDNPDNPVVTNPRLADITDRNGHLRLNVVASW
jgi:hypothetical protein